MLIDVAPSGDRKVIKTEVEKILKCKERPYTMEIQRMWNVKTKVIPVITGVTGNISQTFCKYIRRAHRESSVIGEHQKMAVLDTAHILQKVLT